MTRMQGARTLQSLGSLSTHKGESFALTAISICSIAIPAGVTHRLVRNYLLHYGYAKTLRAFDSAAGISPDADSQACSSRQVALQCQVCKE